MQLSQRCRARDVEDFFSAVGKIGDIRLIMCNKTRRFKGIAYVEFKDVESVALVSITSAFTFEQNAVFLTVPGHFLLEIENWLLLVTH